MLTAVASDKQYPLREALMYEVDCPDIIQVGSKAKLKLVVSTALASSHVIPKAFRRSAVSKSCVALL